MSTTKRACVDLALFLVAFGRDRDFHDAYPQKVYLDRETGDTVWVYDSDDDAALEGMGEVDNRQRRYAIQLEPDRFVEIPGLSHGDHHEILQRFVDSEWTQDAELAQSARNAYHGSIGKWKREVERDCPEALDSFYAFRDSEIDRLAVAFLQSHSIVANQDRPER